MKTEKIYQLILLTTLSLMIIGSTLHVNAQDAIRIVYIPVVTNIQVGPDGNPVITEKEAKKAIEEASKLLGQANIKLVQVSTNDGSRPQSPLNDAATANAGNADGNSSMTPQERRTAEEAAGRELDEKAGSGKGIKITFCNTPVGPFTEPGGASNPGSPGTYGVTGHTSRITFVKPLNNTNIPPPPAGSLNPDRPSKEVMTGTNIAHEIAHMLTMGSLHEVEPGVRADSFGHVVLSPTVRWDNLMFPYPIPGYDPGEGYREKKHGKLTTSQADSISKHAEPRGRVITQSNAFIAPQTVMQQSGGAQDVHDDAIGPEYLDISYVGIYSTVTEPTVDFCAMLLNPVSISAPIDATYRWLLNTDDNLITGTTIAGFTGIDCEINIEVFGDGVIPPTVTAFLINYTLGGIPTPISDVIWESEEEFICYPPNAEPGRQRLLARVDRALLGFTADVIPAALITESLGFGDVVETSLDLLSYESYPTYVQSKYAAFPDEEIDFKASGLTPGNHATLYLDEVAVDDDLEVLPDGTVSGSYSISDAFEDDSDDEENSIYGTRDFLFITVLDEEGEFAFSLINLLDTEQDDDNSSDSNDSSSDSDDKKGGFFAEGDHNNHKSNNMELMAYPNPFSRITKISYNLEGDRHVRLKVFDIMSELVTVLVDEKQIEGSYSVNWDAGDLPTGVYFYTFMVDGEKFIRRAIHIK